MIRRVPWLVFVVLLAAVSCQRSNEIVVPNRVLDRPVDVALSCVRLREDGQVEGLDVSGCSAPDPASCTSEGAPQLIGFVANWERDEVAMFRRCDTVSALVDLDPQAPGYNFVPVGKNPSRIVTTELGCEVVSANVGSCDLSVIDGHALASYAVERPPETASGGLVSTVVPRLPDGQPLAARPGDLLAVPNRLSSAGGEPVGGGSEDPVDVGLCRADRGDSVYVTFPACQLVAEVSLQTERILQSRRIERREDGSFEVIDSGTDPACPVECPGQFSDALPAERDPYDADGFFPTTIALVQRINPEQSADAADDEVSYSALFVGGTGSDSLLEFQFEVGPDGAELSTWSAPSQTLELALEDPKGVHAIRPTPAMSLFGESHQFLYVVSGDGSTHVVDRDFDVGSLGVECDTQLDPTLVGQSACNPIDPNATGANPDRRPFALGPGVRDPVGAAINDWTFHKITSENFSRVCGGDIGDPSDDHVPYCALGVVGIGTTSHGRLVLGVFGQFEAAGSFNETVDPVGVMNISVPPHSLWPSRDPAALDPDPAALPRVGDQAPRRALPGAEDTPQELSPSLRRIDATYAVATDNAAFTPERTALADLLGRPDNVDQLGRFDGNGLYEQTVARIAARDYRQWDGPVTYSVAWEAEIPGTPSGTGRIECDAPGWEDGTCRRPPGGADETPADDARLVDESADFCDSGVLAGDRVVILGCNVDDECGLGQRCLREPTAGSSATGICVSAKAYEDDFDTLRAVCAPFISDPCGAPRRFYEVTGAFQDRLYLTAENMPPTAHVRPVLDDTDAVVGVEEIEGTFTCRLPAAPLQATDEQGNPLGCTDDDDCRSLNGEDYVCDTDGACRGPCPGGLPACYECVEDEDCVPSYGDEAICSDGQCRRPCEPGRPDCTVAPLPGPRCFAEFVRYAVTARNSFVVATSGGGRFITDAVVPVAAEDGSGLFECQHDPSASTLLTSRIRLGADEDETFNDPQFGIADCPNTEQPSPTDPNPCRVVARREDAPASLFHTFAYSGADVPAIRYSNPFFSLVLDLTSLQDLGTIPEAFGIPWPAEMTAFRRARIPQNYVEQFVTVDGYSPFAEAVVVQSTPLVYPVRIINAPEAGFAFVVDAGGRGGVAGVRGQVIRINGPGIDSGTIADLNFLVR